MIDRSNSRPIGIFDSGVGGLTVMRAIMDALPGENLVYLGDTARVPYGTKSPEVISKYAREGSVFLLSREIKLLVFACNTMSATALPGLNDELPVPAVGVILPGAEGACEESNSGRIGIIGTSATIASQAYRRAILRRKPDWQVFSQACPLFVPLAEEGWEETEVALLTARHYLGPIIAQKVDIIVLGCTHYPLLIPTIKRVAGPDIRLVDSASQTAKEVARLLTEAGLRNLDQSGRMKFYLTDIPPSFIGMAGRFLGRPIPHVERIELSG